MTKEEREALIKERQQELEKQRERQASELSAKRASFFSKRTQMEIDSQPMEEPSQLTASERALLKVSIHFIPPALFNSL